MSNSEYLWMFWIPMALIYIFVIVTNWRIELLKKRLEEEINRDRSA